MTEQRKTVRCEHCSLVQFMTASELCRRCHKPLVREEPEPIAALPATPARVPFEVIDWRIGVTLTELRKVRNISQRQLAARMGCPRTYVSKIENGKATPTITSLARFAQALGVTISAFICDPSMRLMTDPFLAELAPLVSKLDTTQQAVVLKTIRQLTQ